MRAQKSDLEYNRLHGRIVEIMFTEVMLVSTINIIVRLIPVCCYDTFDFISMIMQFNLPFLYLIRQTLNKVRAKLQ